MNAIILSGIVLTVLLLSVMLGKKSKLYADRFLIIYLLFLLINYFKTYAENLDIFQQSTWLLLSKGFYLINAPLFFFYVYALTEQKRLVARHYLLMLLPFLAYAVNFFYYDWWGFISKEISIVDGLLYINHQLSLPWTFFVLLFILSDPFYLVCFYVLLRKYKIRIKQSTSFTDHINLNWLNVLFYIWVVSAVVLTPISILSIGGKWITNDVFQWLLPLAHLTCTFIIGYYGFKQTTVFSDLYPEHGVKRQPESQNQNRAAYERSGLSKEQAHIYHSQLLTVMKNKKPYLNGELTAGELAGELGISVNHLSQTLNQEQRQNFFDFVNSYRVEEVKERMKDPRYNHLTLLAIALESGFNSKTSFNTLFKKFTGHTPSQYQKTTTIQ